MLLAGVSTDRAMAYLDIDDDGDIRQWLLRQLQDQGLTVVSVFKASDVTRYSPSACLGANCQGAN